MDLFSFDAPAQPASAPAAHAPVEFDAFGTSAPAAKLVDQFDDFGLYLIILFLYDLKTSQRSVLARLFRTFNDEILHVIDIETFENSFHGILGIDMALNCVCSI